MGLKLATTPACPRIDLYKHQNRINYQIVSVSVENGRFGLLFAALYRSLHAIHQFLRLRWQLWSRMLRYCSVLAQRLLNGRQRLVNGDQRLLNEWPTRLNP